jgi:hypothetical protein
MFNAAGYMIPKWAPGNVNPGGIGTDGTSWTSFMGPASQRSRHKMKCIPLIARRSAGVRWCRARRLSRSPIPAFRS